MRFMVIKKEAIRLKIKKMIFYYLPNVFTIKKGENHNIRLYRYSNIINQNTINILRDPEAESDAGSFLEYFLGETKNGAFFIYSLIEIMLIYEVNLNFVANVELWNERVETLRKYIELKYIEFINDRDSLDCKSFKDINEEID